MSRISRLRHALRHVSRVLGTEAPSAVSCAAAARYPVGSVTAVSRILPLPASRFGLRRAYFTDGYVHFRKQGPQRDWRRIGIMTAVACSFGTYIYVTNLEVVPYTERRHCVLPSVEQERAMGEELYRMILSEHKSEVLPPNHPAVRRLHRVATEICRQAVIQNPDCEHLKDMRWEFNVIQSKEANAFVLPGGKVVVFSSLLHAFNDDELAAVVAHEVGHAVARHNAESLTSRSLINLLKLVLFAVTGIHPGGVGTLLDIGLTLPFSRRQELEADLIGLLLMASACFNPYGAASAHKKLGKMAKDPGVPSFLSTHPHTEYVPRPRFHYQCSQLRDVAPPELESQQLSQ
eukprot:jgi/Mesvir1/24475/Mv21834-RA.2